MVLALILVFARMPLPLPTRVRLTVSGQNRIGTELTLLALIQLTVIKQQAVNNNWL